MRLIQSYVVRNLFSAYWVTGLGLAALFWVLDLLERLEGGVSSLVEVLSLAVSALVALPESVIELLPVIAVLATALAMGRLQTLSELTIIRVAGISIWRLAGIAMLPGLMLAVGSLGVLQWGVPLMQQAPERAVGASLGESGLWHPTHGLWIRQEDQFLNVSDLELGRLPVGINIFEFSPTGGLEQHISAVRAVVLPDGQWRLFDVITTDYRQAIGPTVQAELLWPSFLSGKQLELLLNPPATLSLTNLWQYVSGLKARGQPYAEFELILWQKLALPLACIAMILAAIATAAVPLKSRVIGVRIIGALILGLGFQLITELMSYLGLMMNWPVAMVAIAPPTCLIVLSVWLVAKAR